MAAGQLLHVGDDGVVGQRAVVRRFRRRGGGRRDDEHGGEQRGDGQRKLPQHLMYSSVGSAVVRQSKYNTINNG